MEAYMQILGTLLIMIGVLPTVSPKIAIASVVVGATLWFITYYSDDDNNYIC